MSGGIWQAVVVLLGAAVALEAVLLVAVMRQVGNLLIMIQPGDPRQIAGGPKEDAELHFPGFKARPTVVLFVAPNCEPCHQLTPALSTFLDHNGHVDLVTVVANGSDEDRTRLATELGSFARADLPEMYHEWNIPGTPYGVALDAEARARYSGVVNTLDQLEALATAATAPRQEPARDREHEPEEVVVS